MKEHVAPVLRLPPDFNEDAHVELSFWLDRDGSVVDRCIVRSDSTDLAGHVLRAIDTVAFPPIPHHARCLAGAEIRRTVDTFER